MGLQNVPAAYFFKQIWIFSLHFRLCKKVAFTLIIQNRSTWGVTAALGPSS